MVVQHNLQAMNANRMLNVTTGNQSKSTEKLSSGYKINRAADDAAGLTISEKMRKQMKGLDRASTNAEDGVSAVQTAEGALTEVHSMLQRMNQLAVQASNGTNSEADREAIQNEISQLTTEIDRVSETTKFNEIYLLKGNPDGTSSDMTVAAHDAGLDGKLIDNGSTAIFSKPLADGDKVKIAGTEYTIGAASGKGAAAGEVLKPKDMNKDTSAYVDLDTAADFKQQTLANGDSFTVEGETYTVTNKVSLDEVSFGTAGDTFQIGEYYYKIAAADKYDETNQNGTSATPEEVTEATAKKKIEEALAAGQQVYATKAGATKQDGTVNATGITAATQIVAEYGKNEVSLAGVAAADQTLEKLAQKANGGTAPTIQAGDSFTKGGVTKTAVSAPTSAKEVYDAICTLDKDGTDKVTIGEGKDAVAWTIVSDVDEEDAEAYKVHMDTVLSMIHDGDVVSDGTNTYTVIGDIGAPKGNDSAEKTISAAEAYDMIASELQKASSIGTDEGKEASVTSDGKGNFTITKGSIEVKDALSFSLHVGADADMTNKISVDVEAMSAASLGIKGLNVTDKSGTAGTYAIDAIADAIAKVSEQRSALGAVQNRLEHTIANLDNVVENTTAAESRIRDTDMAEEMVEYSKNNILAQAGQSMLAQANQANQGVLSLLG